MDQKDIPVGYEYLCEYFFISFFERYKTLQTIEKIQDHVLSKKDTLDKVELKQLLDAIDLTKKRLDYYYDMVTNKKLFLSNKEWKEITKPKDYFESIVFLID